MKDKIEQFIFQDKKKAAIIGGVLGIILVILCTVATVGIGLYKHAPRGPMARSFAQLIHYPALYVNHKPIWYTEYLDHYDMLSLYLEKQGEYLEQDYISNDEQIRDTVLEQLIAQQIILNGFDSYDLEVTQDELEDGFQNFLTEANIDEEQAVGVISEVYGLELEEWKERVLKMNIIQNKLAEEINSDEDLEGIKELRGHVRTVLDKLKDGGDFSQLAQEYSDDSVTAQNGGDLGYFSRGMMVPTFEEIAFSLEPGELSDVVESQYGYHIILLDDKRTNEEGVEEVKARHILFSNYTLTDYIRDNMKDSSILSFISGYELELDEN